MTKLWAIPCPTCKIVMCYKITPPEVNRPIFFEHFLHTDLTPLKNRGDEPRCSSCGRSFPSGMRERVCVEDCYEVEVTVGEDNE